MQGGSNKNQIIKMDTRDLMKAEPCLLYLLSPTIIIYHSQHKCEVM